MQQEQIDKASDKYDLFYYTDTYGIYSNEWYGDTLINERSRLVYGGMSSHDLSLLKRAKARHKLIIAEFNTIATPTKAGIRHEFEDMFGVKWSGWVGKYFDVLDTNINYDLPLWLYRNYKKQHNGQWPFKRSGIAFVNIDDHVEVLENIKDLKVEVPYIVTAKRANRDRFTIPRRMKYPYWFDIMYTSHRNNVISTYLIEPTKRGDSILKHWGILKKFPAVIEHIDTNYRFYYFSGDFCDNPIRDRLNSFKGIWYFKPLFYNKKEIGETESFFWKFYMPMVTQILDEYYPIVNSKRHEK
ncbi:MAG: hypothetical protein NTX03_10135 [Bacteroidetes bacterium]|nr:hypothetical protein [Bacteroidota bacterium]